MPLSIVLGRLRFVGVEQTPAPEPAQDSQLNRMPYRLEIRAVGDGQLMKHDARRSLGLAAEDAVRHGNVIVNLEVEAAAKALGKADSAAADVRRRRRISLSTVHERRPKLFALPTPNFANEDASDGAQRRGVACQE